MKTKDIALAIAEKMNEGQSLGHLDALGGAYFVAELDDALGLMLADGWQILGPEESWQST